MVELELPDLIAAVHRLADITNETCLQLRTNAIDCNHDTITEDFTKVSDELALLSVTLRRLEETMTPNPNIYTDIFHSDLTEITQELSFILDEINECCSAMRKTDITTPISWMFKKGRITKLHKHLEALKTTLVVMRHILWEGTDCEKDGNMLSGRAFLEAAIARNRDTISELYNMDVLVSTLDRTPSTMSKRPIMENGPLSTCVCGRASCTCVPIEDVLSPSKLKNTASVYEKHLNRRFSKRGVRLGVHSSILDHGAHDAPEYLRRKWTTQARSDNQHGLSAIRPALIDLSTNLSTIAESESVLLYTDGQKENERRVDDSRPKTSGSWPSMFGNVTRTNSSKSFNEQSSEHKANSIGRKVKTAIRKISHMNLRSRNNSDAEDLSARESKGKENEQDCININHERKDFTGERKRDHILRTIYYGPSMCPPHWSDGEDTEAQQSGLA